MNKYILSFIVVLFTLLQSCGLREREDSLQQKEARLNEKEQQLLLREKSIQIKEEELVKKQQATDSSATADSAARYNANLVGSWNVQMTCTATTCSGSAVGDTKTETWEISYQDTRLLVQAKVNNELVRTYTGESLANTIELKETPLNVTQPQANILVRLRMTSDTKLEGEREIERLNEKCKIVYAMTMDKQ